MIQLLKNARYERFQPLSVKKSLNGLDSNKSFIDKYLKSTGAGGIKQSQSVAPEGGSLSTRKSTQGS